MVDRIVRQFARADENLTGNVLKAILKILLNTSANTKLTNYSN